MEVEEGEAGLARDGTVEKTPYDVLEGTRTSVEEVAAKMLLVKKEGRPKLELRELVAQISLLFVNLRQVNRLILSEEDRIKSETDRAKAPVDFSLLQLQNLMYEKNHYVKAIKACKDFRSKHPDIELVPEEEFFSSAPEEIKGSVSKDQPHELMLRRLNFELLQRKELCKLHEELEERKKGLLETIESRRKFLSSLPSHLKSLKKASIPIQHQLGILHTKKLKQHHLAELLPPPLYIIYSQFLTQKEAFGEKIDVEIVGILKDAQSLVSQNVNKVQGSGVNMDHVKQDDDILDDEEDGQRRKRLKKVVRKEGLPHVDVYQSHPLNVILHVYDEEKAGKLVILRFEYLIKLNTVCAGIEGSEDGPESSILCNLFPDDTGVDPPYQTAKLILGSTVPFDDKRPLRPYKWAQHLAGIDFLPEVSPFFMGSGSHGTEGQKDTFLSGLSLYRQQSRVRTVVQRIRSRKKAQVALLEQLDSLATCNWPQLIDKNLPWGSHIPLCSLKSWALSPTMVSVPAAAMTQAMDSLEHDMDGRSESIREDGELPVVIQAPACKMTSVVKKFDLEHSARLALISKSIVPDSSAKSLCKKNEDNLEVILDDESEVDEVADIDLKLEPEGSPGLYEASVGSWEDFGTRTFYLVMSRKMSGDENIINLGATIKISMEYPLRPPLFILSLPAAADSGAATPSDCSLLGSKWFNELRAMEAEINVHIIKMLPAECENQILAHQVWCLGMLFDFLINDSCASTEAPKGNSLVDVGLCKPVSGRIASRSFRGRDRRRMFSWREGVCTSGYPC